jgi:threonine synthase
MGGSVFWVCRYCGFKADAFSKYYWRCPVCGKPLSIECSISGEITNSKNVWERYRGFIPFVPDRYRGEGLTPLIVEKVQGHTLLFKLEYLNPGGSFKDRGTALAIYYGFKMGFKKSVVDTSGNTGIAVTLFSRLYGLEPLIVMPRTAPEGKKRAVRMLGGRVVEAENRDEANRMVQNFINEPEAYYVAHLWNPLYIVGHATIAYEVYEDFGVPDYIIVPVGSGGLLLGLAYGFEKLKELGRVGKVPRIIAVQGYSVQPVYMALYGRRAEGEESTLADGIMVSNPPRLNEIVDTIRKTDGDVVLVGNTEVLRAFKQLWEWGFTVEPTSATVYAAYEKISRRIPEGSSVLLVLTGTGFKTLLQL